MDIRAAFLKTADLFDRSPDAYKFLTLGVPTDCGSPGCMVGHVAAFMGVGKGFSVFEAECEEVLEVPYAVFMGRIAIFSSDNREMGPVTRSPAAAAKCLRQYADKYHPVSEKESKGMPQWALDIFQPEKIAA